MKLYRSIDEKELEDIKKNNRIRFENPFWNFKSEGKIVNIFRLIEDFYNEKLINIKYGNDEERIVRIFEECNSYDNKEKIKKRIKDWVNSYRESDYQIKKYENKDIYWYNIFTELSQVVYLFFTNYCKSFSRINKEVKIGDKINSAILEIDVDFNESSILRCIDDKCNEYNLNKILDGKTYELVKNNESSNIAYIRHYPINYKDTYNYDTVFEELAKTRCLIELLNIVSSNYEEQEEERAFINLKVDGVLPSNAPNSLGWYSNWKYDRRNINEIHENKNDEQYIDDVIEAMYIQFVYTYIEIKEKLPQYMYIYLKDDIKICEIKK